MSQLGQGARLAVFLQELQELGWTDGRNVRIDYRWAAADADRSRTYAAELVALARESVQISAGLPRNRTRGSAPEWRDRRSRQSLFLAHSGHVFGWIVDGGTVS